MSLSLAKTPFSVIAGFLTFSLLFLAGDANAQTGSETIGPVEFEEVYDRNPVVSGPSLFVALYDASSENDRFATDIAVSVGASSHGKICLQGFSRDKKYIVNASYDMGTLGEGSYALEFPTKHASVLSRYGKYDVALSLWFAGDCTSRIGEIELLHYNAGKRADVRLLVHSKGASSTVTNESADTITTCEPIADTPTVRSVAYDTICHVEGGSDDTFRVETSDLFGIILASQRFRIATGR